MPLKNITVKHVYALSLLVLVAFIFLLHIADLRIRILTSLFVLIGTLGGQFYFFTQKIKLEHEDRMNAEILLVKEKEYYNSFVESMIDWVWEIDLKGKYIYSNNAVEDILGYTIQDILGKNISDLWSDYDKTDSNYAVLNTILSSGKGLKNYKTQFKHKHGRKIFTESMMIPVFDDDQKLKGYRGVARDITKRVIIEKSFRNSEKRFRDLTDLLPQTICEMNEKNSIMFLNKTGYQIFGFTEDDLNRGISGSKIFIQKDYEKAISNFSKVMNGGQNVIDEYTAIKKDGTKFPVIFYIAPMLSENRIEGVRGIIVDITEQKKTEVQLKKSYQELEHAQEAIIELERKNTAMAMGVTANHEINQPLYVIKMNLGMLSKVVNRESQDDKYGKFLLKMDKALLQIQTTLDKYKELESVRFEDYNDDIKMLVFDKEGSGEDSQAEM